MSTRSVSPTYKAALGVLVVALVAAASYELKPRVSTDDETAVLQVWAVLFAAAVGGLNISTD